jgi:hypothetical protein
MARKPSRAHPFPLLEAAPAPPRTGTPAARDFWSTYERTKAFGAFVLSMAAHIDAMRGPIRNLKEALAKSDDERAEIRAQDANYRGAMADVAANRQVLLEILLVRHVENYLSYLSSILFEILRQRPEAMKSQDKVDLEFVISHASRESLIRGLAERKVDSLSYASFDKLAEYFENHFHIAICSDNDRDLIREAIETRNISVHNRCRINRRYLERVPNSTRKRGSLRALVLADLEALLPALYRSVRKMDRDARRRLKLRGRRFDVRAKMMQEREEAFVEFKKLLASEKQTT